MRPVIQRLYEKIEEQIKAVQEGSFPLLREISQCIEIWQEAMHELKRIIEKHPLKDLDEEIEFFKGSSPNSIHNSSIMSRFFTSKFTGLRRVTRCR
ncbi:MAG: hypothetical protein BGO52_21765 [Sphingobacteriales bacterium 44-61]|nr:MAG: hypothetical protein BGO52_21765 [Sphingobacteriales bacterium 44-61]